MTEFKVGDRVRILSCGEYSESGVTIGETYVVCGDDATFKWFIDDDGNVRFFFDVDGTPDNGAIIELATEAPSPDTFITETKHIDYGGVFLDPNYPDIEVEVNDVGLGDIVLYQDDGGDSGVYDEIYISHDRLKAFAKALLELAEALEKDGEE